MTAYYKIRAVNGIRESEDSDPRSICVGFYKENELLERNSFYLAQNHPNPFNPITSIKFSIAENLKVNISVYDLLGNKVTQLLNEERVKGEYEIIFDGSALPSGIYFYIMQAGNFIDVKKLILIK
jgi:hypothetical protein